MRKGTSFSEKKLSCEEFSHKYWDNGEHPYQYHTGTIQDGRDEREQFLFNNCRALWKMIWQNNKCLRMAVEEQRQEVLSKLKRIAALAVTSTAISIVSLLVVLLAFLSR